MKVIVENIDDTSFITLHGPIAEHAGKPLYAALPEVKQKNIVVDCEDVSAINSIGCIGWLTFVKALSNDMKSLKFRKCSSVFMDLATLIGDFLGTGGKIESFFISYVCDNCDHSISHLIVTADVLKGEGTAGTVCPKCSTKMESGSGVDDYMQLLKR